MSEKENIESMIVKNITITNFKSYPHASVRLEPLTIVSGNRNGSGKTTISESICYGMTGKLYRLNPKDAIRHGNDTMSVSLRGTFGSDSFEIKRSHNDTHEISYEIDHDMYRDKQAEEMLGNIIEYEEFINLVNVDGHNIEELVEGTPAERAKILDKMFGIDAIETVIKKLNPRKYKSQVEDIKDDIKSKTELLANLKHLLDETSFKSELKNDLKNKEEEIERLEKELNILKKSLDEFKKKESTIQKKETFVVSLDKKIKTLIDKKELISSSLHSKSKQYGEILNKIKNETKNIASLDALCEDYTKKIAQLQEEIEDMSRMSNIKKIIPIIQKKAQNGTFGHSCPICNHTIDMSSISVNNDTFQEQYNELVQKKSDLQSKKQRIMDLKDRKESLSTQMVTLKKENIKLDTIIEKLKEKRSHVEFSDDLDAEKYKKIQINYSKKYSRQETLRQEASVVKIRLERIEKNKKSDTTVPQLEQEITELEHRKENVIKIIAKLEKLREGFNKVQKNVRKETLEEINPRITQLINLLHARSGNKEAITQYQVNVVETRWGVRYGHAVVRNGIPCPLDALSTGERAVCIIALIISIIQASYHRLGLIVFDEIHTSGIDTEATDKLLKAIAVFSKKINIMFIDRREKIIETIKIYAKNEGIDIVHYEAHSNNGVSTIKKV